MTDDMMNLRALVEKTPDADLLREMIGFAAQRLMELEVGSLTGAGYGEKTPERLAQEWREAMADPDTLKMRGDAGRAVAVLDAADRLADLVEHVARK